MKLQRISDAEKVSKASISPSSKYIGVYLQGGLGNQLFQLAFGIEMALLFSKKLILIQESYLVDSKRKFELNNFGFKHSRAYEFGIIDKEISKIEMGEPADVNWVLESEVEFSYKLPSAKKFISENCLLRGYWQSELYFESYKEPIIRHLREFLPKVKIEDCVMHIRRGDFMLPGIREYHGLLDFQYYKKALNLLVDVNEITIISDDYNQVDLLNQLQKAFPMKVFNLANAGTDELSDLALMANANNLILANSSFSWWGATLNHNEDVKVLAPRNYFTPSIQRINNTCDLYPSPWILI